MAQPYPALPSHIQTALDYIVMLLTAHQCPVNTPEYFEKPTSNIKFIAQKAQNDELVCEVLIAIYGVLANRGNENSRPPWEGKP